MAQKRNGGSTYKRNQNLWQRKTHFPKMQKTLFEKYMPKMHKLNKYRNQQLM